MSRELKISKNKKEFRILSFTDTHIDDWADRAVYTWKAIEETIKAEKPDLVVFVGDNVTGGDNRQRLKDFCNNLDRLGVPWAPILGNHEGDNPISVRRKEMVERFAQSEYCLIESEVKFLENGEQVEGEGNTVIHIKNDAGEIVTTLFFLDSGTDLTEEEKCALGFPVEKSKDGFLRESQIAWYKEELQKRHSQAPVMVFAHYPLQEYKEAYELATEEDRSYEADVEKKARGVNGEEKTAKWLFGYRREGICAQTVNTGMFSAMRDSGVKHTYICGHDHVNDFRVEYQGVNLFYNAPGSYSSYNVLSKGDKITVGRTDKLLQGCNIFTIHEDKTMDTEYINYADRYPEMQEGVMQVIRLK